MQGSILSVASHKLMASRLPGFLAPNLALSGGGKNAYYHGLRFRPAHLAGGVVEAIAVVGATDRDVRNGNRQRFKQIFQRTEKCLLDLYSFLRSKPMQ